VAFTTRREITFQVVFGETFKLMRYPLDAASQNLLKSND